MMGNCLHLLLDAADDVAFFGRLWLIGFEILAADVGDGKLICRASPAMLSILNLGTINIIPRSPSSVNKNLKLKPFHFPIYIRRNHPPAAGFAYRSIPDNRERSSPSHP